MFMRHRISGATRPFWTRNLRNVQISLTKSLNFVIIWWNCFAMDTDMVEMIANDASMTSDLETVYCFRLGGDNCFKVGRTKNSPEDRKRGFSTGSPVKCNLYRKIETGYAPELEKCIHLFLDPKRAENGEIFYVTAQELDDAVDRAVAFVQKSQPLLCEANRLRGQKLLNAMLVEPTSEMFQIYRELRAKRHEKNLIEQQIAFLESQIQVAIGNNSGMRGIASWRWTDRWTMDMERFKKEQDALYQEYKRNSGSRRFCLERIDLTKAQLGVICTGALGSRAGFANEPR